MTLHDDSTLLFTPDDLVLGDHESGRVATRRGTSEGAMLNPVAERVLTLLADPLSRSDLRAQLYREYALEAADECWLDEFLASLQGMGWLEALPECAGDAVMRNRYLALLKRALVNWIYPEHELRMRYLASDAAAGLSRLERERVLRDIRRLQPEAHAALRQCKQVGGVLYGEPTRDAHTMVGLRRLHNLEYCARRIVLDEVPGDFLEAGVCQGGASIFLRALQVSLGLGDRRTWVADSFEGLPSPTLPEEEGLDLTEARYPWLAIDEATVRHHFDIYGLLDEGVRFLPGWFSETLAAADTGPLALLRLDGDLYESTRDALVALYDRVSPGGYVIIDDYVAFPQCQRAVEEFRAARGIATPLRAIDWTSVFWRKPM